MMVMIPIYFTRYIKNSQKLLLSLLTLAPLLVISLSSLSFLVQINTIGEADAAIETSNTTITSEPRTITAQPPVEQKTGQIVLPPPKTFIVKDPITGQPEVSNLLTKDPIINPGSVTQTIDGNSTAGLEQQNSLISMNGLPLGISTASPGSSLGLNLVQKAGIIPSSTNTISNDQSTLNPTNTISNDQSTVNPTNTISNDQSTVNPMFSSCDTNQFEMAKYSIIGHFDKDSVNTDDFSLDIFADIVDKDNSTFDSNDHPYKAYFKTNNEGKIPIDIKKFMTICADITDLDVANKMDTDVGKNETLNEFDMNT
jgi:hypothetical protein